MTTSLTASWLIAIFMFSISCDEASLYEFVSTAVLNIFSTKFADIFPIAVILTNSSKRKIYFLHSFFVFSFTVYS